MDAASTRYLYQRLHPDPVAVTLMSRTGDDPPAWESYSLLAKAMRIVTSQQMAGGAVLARRTRGFQFWLALIEQATAVAPAVLPCPNPRPGDKVAMADGTVWAIDSLEEKLFGNCFSCQATEEP